VDNLVNKARTSHPIRLAGGLSLAGLCVGIFSLGKKAERRTGRRPSVEPHPEQPRPFAKASDHVERQHDLAGAYQSQQVESPGCSDTETIDMDECSLESTVIEVLAPEVQDREIRTSREVIEDLAGKGESTLAIAQALGISVGEVQLTLKLQQFSASAGRRP
jgi:hypothetical protein